MLAPVVSISDCLDFKHRFNALLYHTAHCSNRTILMRTSAMLSTSYSLIMPMSIPLSPNVGSKPSVVGVQKEPRWVCAVSPHHPASPGVSVTCSLPSWQSSSSWLHTYPPYSLDVYRIAQGQVQHYLHHCWPPRQSEGGAVLTSRLASLVPRSRTRGFSQ